ncbi:MAG: 50S ribosome-binding GTPase, partial [Clostridia bacterium]|nr:50S ribosome-binding GTPase [Clostridia bacterium]
ALKTVDQAVRDVCREKIERDRKKGILGRRIKAMVAGIPNVGKSTFINTMAGRAVSKTGNLPGVTRGTQWIRLNQSIDLLDTPGILWPKFDDETVGEYLAFTGAVSADVVDLVSLSVRLLEVLSAFPGDPVKTRYGISLEDVDSPEALLTEIAVRKNCMKKMAEPDVDRMGKTILEEFRAGKLGRITLELPEN